MREWKPGDVGTYNGQRCMMTRAGMRWEYGGTTTANHVDTARLLVIDPEDREQVERLRTALFNAGALAAFIPAFGTSGDDRTSRIGAALREFADPTPPKPDEPTDPKARVTDRRDNIWRLLADGEWVCTSGPDIGEYLAWSGLVERGPLTVEATP